MSTQQSDISSGVTAPPPDTAAASPSTDAAPSDSSVVGTEAAASTEKGARPLTTEAALDKAYDDAMKAAKGEPETVKEPEKPKEEVEAKTEVEEESEVKTEEDPLAEFEAKTPTPDEFKAKYPRAQKAMLEEVGGYLQELTTLKTTVAELGGDEGLAFAKAIVPLVFEGNVTPENVEKLFGVFNTVNPQIVAGSGRVVIQAGLNDDLPDPTDPTRTVGQVFADGLLQGEWEGYGHDRIDGLVKFDKLLEGYDIADVLDLVKADKDGLIDWSTIDEGENLPRDETRQEKRLKKENETKDGRISELEGQVKQLRGETNEKAIEEQKRLNDTVIQTASQVVMAEVLPIARKLGMAVEEGATGEGVGWMISLGSDITDAMNMRIMQTPAWDAMQVLVRQGTAFTADGKPTVLMRTKLESIARTAKAMFIERARKHQPLIKAAAAAISKNGSIQTPTGRSEDTKPPPPQLKVAPARPKTLAEEIAEKDAEYDRKVRDARAAG